jgi:Zn-dependent peptidase ImmA (M78 family)
MTPCPPIPSKASRSRIWEIAETAAQKLGVSRGAPLEQYVAKLGGRIIYKNATKENDKLLESIIVKSRNDFTIFLPVMTSISRDRFTIAHELGHLFLHYPLVEQHRPGVMMAATRWVDQNNQDLLRAEWEANWFAEAFLMPSRDACEEIDKSDLKGQMSWLSGLVKLTKEHPKAFRQPRP